MAPKNPKQAALEKKAQNEEKKNAEEKKKLSAVEAEDWKRGANERASSREEAKAQKDEEAARKRREKAELEAQEEASLNVSGKLKKLPTLTAAKKNIKKKDEFSLLEEALVGDAEKKAKEKKREERLKKEREERAAAANRQKLMSNNNPTNEDPLLANTEEMIGGAAQYFDADSSDVLVGSKANRAMGVDNSGGSGLNAALGQLSVSKASIDHPEKRMKALHLAFEERMMPTMKEDYPGLKMSQYKERIFNLWKKSPENPSNWPAANSPQKR